MDRNISPLCIYSAMLLGIELIRRHSMFMSWDTFCYLLRDNSPLLVA